MDFEVLQTDVAGAQRTLNGRSEMGVEELLCDLGKVVFKELMLSLVGVVDFAALAPLSMVAAESQVEQMKHGGLYSFKCHG